MTKSQNPRGKKAKMDEVRRGIKSIYLLCEFLSDVDGRCREVEHVSTSVQVMGRGGLYCGG